MNADIAAGVGIWRARRDQRARERAARHRRDQPNEPKRNDSYLMDVDPQEGGRTLDEAMTTRAKEELRAFRKELRGADQGPVEKRSHQKDSQRRKQVKRKKAKEKKAEAKERSGVGEREGPEARFAPGTDPEEQAQASSTEGMMSGAEGPGNKEVRFGEGPKVTRTTSHTYNPVDLSHYYSGAFCYK